MTPDRLALGIVSLAGLYLVGFGLAAIARPHGASMFLGEFAGSARAHYLELSIRLLVGLALVAGSPQMPFAGAFALFGWILVATTAALVFVPWQWHRRFAERVLPPALRHLKLIGICSVAMGGLLITGAVVGATTY